MFDKIIVAKNKIDINKIIEILLILTVFFIPISRSGMNTFSFFIFILWVIKKIKNKSILNPESDLSKWLIFYSFILFLPLINFASKEAFLVILDTFISTYLKYIILFVVTVEIIDNNEKFKKVFLSFFISATLVIGYGFYEFLFKGFRGRLTSTYNNANTAGSYFMMIALFAFSYLLFNKNKKYKIISFMYFLSSTILLMLTYSRGAWLGYIFGIILALMIFIYRLETNKSRIIMIVSFLILVTLSVLLLPTSVIERFKSIDNLESKSINQRLIQYKVGFNILKDYPILGVGIGRFSEIFNEYKIEGAKSFRHIHNIYLDVAVETGLLGFFTMVIIIYKSIIKKIFININNKKGFGFGFLLIFIGNIVHNSVDWTFLHSMVGLNLIIIAALWFNYKKGKYAN
ncbi:MAG: O-antigen ligase family protein [Bacillota bacterium]